MKHGIICLCICLVSLNPYAQIQNGVVRRQNSGKQPIAGVAIRFDGAVPASSDDNGKFRLAFAGKKPGDLVFKNEISKLGYELVNGKDLEVIRISTNDIFGVDIIMAAKGTVDAAKIEYYSISDKALSENFSQQKNALEVKLQKSLIDQKAYRAQILVLGQQYKSQKQALDSLSEKFARINFDDVSEVYIQAIEAFKAGQIGSAISKLENASLAKRYKEIASAEQQLATNKNEVNQSIRLQIELYQLSFDFNKAELFYEEVLDSSNSNMEILHDFADFLRNQNNVKKALLNYYKLINSTTSDLQRGTAYNQIGNLLRSQQRMGEAEAAYQQALNIFKALNMLNRDKFVLQVGLTLNNIGNYHRANKEWLKARLAFNESVVTFRSLVSTGQKQYLPHLALSLNNLGNAYFSDRSQNSNLIEAKNAYNECLDIYQRLADDNPEAIIPEDMMSFFDLRITTTDNSKTMYMVLDEYEVILNKALAIHRKLSAKRPESFLPFVTLTLNNFGNLYLSQSKYDDAEAAYREALAVSSDLASRNYEAYCLLVANSLISLAKFYNQRNMALKSEEYYLKAIGVYKSVSEIMPESFVSEMENVYRELGALKERQREPEKARYYYNEAARLRI